MNNFLLTKSAGFAILKQIRFNYLPTNFFFGFNRVMQIKFLFNYKLGNKF